jgi:hypothetical protein
MITGPSSETILVLLKRADAGQNRLAIDHALMGCFSSYALRA